MKRLIVAVALAGAACARGERQRTHLSDSELLANFTAHRAAFERLLTMAQEDSSFFRIAHDRAGMAGASNEEAARRMPPDRWNEYRRLFREADVPEGISRPTADLVLFCSSSQRFRGRSMKGYAYSTQELPRVATLNDRPPLDFGRDMRGKIERRFTWLGGGWYLFYEVS